MASPRTKKGGVVLLCARANSHFPLVFIFLTPPTRFCRCEEFAKTSVSVTAKTSNEWFTEISMSIYRRLDTFILNHLSTPLINCSLPLIKLSRGKRINAQSSIARSFGVVMNHVEHERERQRIINVPSYAYRLILFERIFLFFEGWSLSILCATLCFFFENHLLKFLSNYRRLQLFSKKGDNNSESNFLIKTVMEF